MTLPMSQYPEIAPPTVTVSATYPGANAKTVAETVATPIEEQVNGVESMLYMSSQSTNDGNLTLTVTFKVGTNLDVAQVQVQNRVAIALPQLPQEVQQQGITVKKASPDITLAIAFYSPDNSHDTALHEQLRDAADQRRDRAPAGRGRHQHLRRARLLDAVVARPRQAGRRAIMTVGDVVNAVQEQNVQVAAGIVGGPPLPPGRPPFQYTMNAQGRLTDPDAVREISWSRSAATGASPSSSDVGRVELGAADYSTTLTYNGHPAVGMAVFQLPGTNAIETANAIYAKMAELKRRFPAGVGLRHPYDTTLFVRDSIRDVIQTLLERGRAGGAGGARLPAKLARRAGAAAGHSGFADRDLRGDVAAAVSR